MSKLNVTKAMQVLTKALNEDDQYRYSWQANIAMFVYDAILRMPECAEYDHEAIHRGCNAGAIEFLNILTKPKARKSD